MVIAEDDESYYKGKITDITFDFESNKTVLCLDTATVIINGIHREFVGGEEYEIWLDVNGSLESSKKVAHKDKNNNVNLLIIVGLFFVALGLLLLLIIAVDGINSFKRYKPKERYCRRCGKLFNASNTLCPYCYTRCKCSVCEHDISKGQTYCYYCNSEFTEKEAKYGV
jgi:hypothetical protein